MANYSYDQEKVNPKRFFPLISIVIVVLLVIISWNTITVSIPAGHAGVLFRQFGGGVDTEKTYGEGFHFIAPWNTMFEYDVRQHEIAEEMQVLSSNGLEINTDVSVWFQPVFDKVGILHKRIGADYLHKIVIPAIRSSARSVIGRYTPEEIYSTKRESIQDEIFVETKKLLDQKDIQLNQVLIRSIKLPPTIKTAIESKLKQEQEALEYEFKLQKAQKEANRQKIEAEGKATANRIVSESLTDKILREKGIEATLNLATSPNSKVIVIGGRDGMPIILGDVK